MVHVKKEEGKEIKVKHDEKKKFLYNPQYDSLHYVNNSLDIF